MPPNGGLADGATVAFRQENPKRKGTKSHDRYEKYKVATTVAEAIRLGAVRGDIQNDVKQGFCCVADGNEAAPDLAVAAVGAKRGIDAGVAPGGDREGSAAGVKRRRGVAPAMEAPPAVGAAAAVEELGTVAELAAPAPAESASPRHLASTVPAAAPAVPAESAPAVPVESAPAVPAAAPAVLAESSPVVPAAAPAVVAAPTASESAMARAPKYEEVDLTFANLDGKPLKFVKRVMGEARRLLSPAGLQEAEKEGYQFALKDRDHLAKWGVKLRDLNPEGHLAKDLAKHNLEPCIDLELSLPDGFPMEPPFARVVYPQLKGGYVFTHGGICFEPLTAKGWVPSMTLAALAIAIKGILDYGDVRMAGAGNREQRTVPQYTEEGARKDHKHIVSAHNGGDGNTYGSLKRYQS
mmetsp:Transcript_61919/g.136119  ORF Transcript_61919/g.136119 Transcript_61919/m.136119 type:complete len:410 (+) Transcript_61919:81-1310(+)